MTALLCMYGDGDDDDYDDDDGSGVEWSAFGVRRRERERQCGRASELPGGETAVVVLRSCGFTSRHLPTCLLRTCVPPFLLCSYIDEMLRSICPPLLCRLG